MILYETAIIEGRQIIERQRRDQWRLGEIASELEPKYGEATLERYAADIGINFNTLQTYVTTYRAWHTTNISPERFSVAKALASHPDRVAIVQANPNITKRQAERITRQRNYNFTIPQPTYNHPTQPTNSKSTETMATLFLQLCNCGDIARNEGEKLHKLLSDNPTLIAELSDCIKDHSTAVLDIWQKIRQFAGSDKSPTIRRVK